MRSFNYRLWIFVVIFIVFAVVATLPPIHADIQQPAHVLGAFTANDCASINVKGFLVSSLVNPCGGTLPAQYKTKACVVITGDPGAASPVLADDNDTPVGCDNDTGADWTITSVACWADAVGGGQPTVNPILTGGAATSILSSALPCGNAAFASGSLNGTPVVHSWAAGNTCSVTPCSIDANIATAGGVAKYIVVKIAGTY